MAKVVVMPQLGNSVESCLITSWEVAVGDRVEVGTVLCSIETDKASMEVPSTDFGTVLKLLWAEGDDVPVKEPLVILGEPGENVDDNFGKPAGPSAPTEQPSTSSSPAPSAGDQPQTAAANATGQESAPCETPQTGTCGASPRARNLAAVKNFELDLVSFGTGPHGRILERDVQAGIAGTRVGSGIGGRTLSTDETVAPTQLTPTPTPTPVTLTDEFPGTYTDVPLKGIRKLIAERMMNSLASSAQLTYNSSACASGLLALRRRFKEADASLGMNEITIGDLVGFAVVKTLANHPNHNGHLSEGVLRLFDQVHLGFACDTPRGLLVPTIRNASSLNLREFSALSKQLAQDAIAGKINPDLLSGATFTVTNLGGFGIESFTPLINLPQVAILGVDAIFPRAITQADGSIGIEQRIGFSLTADHQVIDGADAARFLSDLAKAIENIDITILG